MIFLKKLNGGDFPLRLRTQRISETMLSTALSTATPSLWILRPTCVFMESLPQDTIIPVAAPAINPAPIPIQNPVHSFMFSHSFFGLWVV